MTGSRHFARENERRTREAIKALGNPTPGTYEAAAIEIAAKYALTPAEVRPVVMAHGIEVAELLARLAVSTAHTLGAVSAFYEALQPRPKAPSAEELKQLLGLSPSHFEKGNRR